MQLFPYVDKNEVYIDVANEKFDDIKSTSKLVKNIEGNPFKETLKSFGY